MSYMNAYSNDFREKADRDSYRINRERKDRTEWQEALPT